MPKFDEHLSKANHNEQFCTTFDLGSTPFLDWVVTGLFYGALHYIDAYLATQGTHPSKHHGFQQRNDRIEHTPELGSIWPHYRALHDDSRDARYGYHPFGLREFTESEVTQLRDVDFANLKKTILRLPGMS